MNVPLDTLLNKFNSFFNIKPYENTNNMITRGGFKGAHPAPPPLKLEKNDFLA